MTELLLCVTVMVDLYSRGVVLKRSLNLLGECFSLLTEVSGILEEIENSYSLCLIMEEKLLVY